MSISAQAVVAALRKRFAPPAWAFLEEVRNGTGYTRTTTRYADALAMSVWPSRGLELVGFEVKVARQDWLQEMRNPAKAESIQKFCDRWYLVAGDDEIVQPGELPPTWGLLVLSKKGGLKTVVEAPKLDAKPIDRLMLASMLRNVSESYVPRGSLARLVEERVKEVADIKQQQYDARLVAEQQKNEDLRQAVKDFEAAAGVSISQYSAGNIGKAVRLVLEVTGQFGYQTKLEHIMYTAKKVAAEIEAGLKEIAAAKSATDV